jgi:hypothetical protein
MDNNERYVNLTVFERMRGMGMEGWLQEGKMERTVGEEEQGGQAGDKDANRSTIGKAQRGLLAAGC